MSAGISMYYVLIRIWKTVKMEGMMDDTMLWRRWLWLWRIRRRRSRRKMKKEKKKACCVLLNVSWILYPHVTSPFRHWCHRLDCRLGYVWLNSVFRLQTFRCSVLLSSGPYRLSQTFLEYLAWTCSGSRPSMGAYRFRCLQIAGLPVDRSPWM